MSKLKILLCFGTRPEAVKMAPLVKKLKNDNRIDTVICVTAQHREMLDQVLAAFSITPDFDLDIMKKRQSLSHITGTVLSGLDDIIKNPDPDIVLVHGDTTTTFSASLAGFYNKTLVGHVEAGLRTYNKYSPFPEEMNRKLTSSIAQIHFAPTQNNMNNLLRESINENDIFITGNTAIDALKTTVCENHHFGFDALNKIDFQKRRVITLTAHRRENIGDPLYNILKAVKRLVERFDDIEVVYPVHLNPEVGKAANEVLSGIDRIQLIPPLDIVDMHNLMAGSYLIMTDSGGLQEEAPSLGKPVLVLRTETERPEAVAAGTVKVSGINEQDIYDDAKELLENKEAYSHMAGCKNPYGDGKSSERIKNAILYYYGIISERPDEWKVSNV